MTKKKKNARERRALVGALCTAAVIVAGSTFAWYTSQDDVTNRLTANADYGVSIVESFSPPANWIPGQKVEKDVYAVNTGNIAAFVNEDISGVMSVTYEIQSDTFVSSTAVKLNDTEVSETMFDGATTHEGGAFLAYTTSSTPTGYLVSSRTQDNLTGAWHPTEAGVYIFRRSITVASSGAETYKYDGYYFDGTNYYKIAISSTPAPAVIDDSEGKLSSVAYKYVLDLEETAKAVGMYYDAENTRLVATYALNPAANFPYDAQALAARNEVDKTNANATMTTATTNYDNANTALTNINALITARNKVVEEAIKLNAALSASTAADTAKETAATGVTSAVDAITIPTFPTSATEDTNSYTDGSAIKTSVDKYNGLIDTVSGTSNGDIKELNDALTALKTATAPRDITTAQNALNKLKTDADNLLKAYAEIKDNGAAYDTDGAIKLALKSFRNSVNDLDLTNLSNAITTYNNAVTAATSAASAVSATAYGTALTNYSSALTTAGGAEAVDDKYKVNNTTTYTDTDAGKTAVANNAALTPYPMNAETEGSYSYTVGTGAAAVTHTVAEWKSLKESAEAKYNEINGRTGAVPTSDKTIDIYINLDPSFASYWDIESSVATDVAGKQEKVSFFLKHILAEGETSEKLIDNLVLAPETENVFKSFTFDLNVHLDSAQITYEDDQRTMNASAVLAPAFEETPTPSTGLSLDSVLTWAGTGSGSGGSGGSSTPATPTAEVVYEAITPASGVDVASYYTDATGSTPATGTADGLTVYYQKVTYTPVASPTGNPSTSDYYVKSGASFVAATDTEVQTGTTYYTKS